MIEQIVFETTTECNLSCRYCYNHWKAPGAEKLFFNSYKQSRKVLKKLFKQTDIKHVTFTGGEPFLSERFTELVLFTRMKGKTVTIISNGNTGDTNEYSDILNLGINLFEFPLHSATPESHDQMTGTPGSWLNSLNSIKHVLKTGGSVAVAVVLTRYNFKGIVETIDFLKDLGIKQIMLNRFNIGGTGIRERKNLELNHLELKETYKSVDSYINNNSISITSNVCTPRCILIPEEYPNISFSYCNPDISKRVITMNPHGDLRVCNHSPITFGNVLRDNLNDILTSTYIESWKERPDYCKDCKVFHRCFGGCRAASEQLQSDLNCVDPMIKTSIPTK